MLHTTVRYGKDFSALQHLNQEHCVGHLGSTECATRDLQNIWEKHQSSTGGQRSTHVYEAKFTKRHTKQGNCSEYRQIIRIIITHGWRARKKILKAISASDVGAMLQDMCTVAQRTARTVCRSRVKQSPVLTRQLPMRKPLKQESATGVPKCFCIDLFTNTEELLVNFSLEYNVFLSFHSLKTSNESSIVYVEVQPCPDKGQTAETCLFFVFFQQASSEHLVSARRCRIFLGSRGSEIKLLIRTCQQIYEEISPTLLAQNIPVAFRHAKVQEFLTYCDTAVEGCSLTWVQFVKWKNERTPD